MSEEEILAECYALAEAMGCKLEPPSGETRRFCSVYEVPPPMLVLRARKPSYDIAHFDTLEEAVNFLREHKNERAA